MVANNAAGVRSFGYGAARLWVDALDVVLPDGRQARFAAGAPDPLFASLQETVRSAIGPGGLDWPRTSKNSSGYALDHFLTHGCPVQLLVGSEGTLGLVTGIRMRTAPLPRQRALVLMPAPDLDALQRIVGFAQAAHAAACEFFGHRFVDVAGLRSSPAVGDVIARHPAVALVEVDGRGGDVEDQIARACAVGIEIGAPVRVGRTEEERSRLWEIRHAASPIVAARAAEGLVSMQFIEDSVVPTERLAHYLVGLEQILEAEETDAVVFGHAGDGNVHVNPLVDVRRPDWRDRVGRILDRTVGLVVSLGGTLSGEHGDGRLRAPFHPRVFGPRVADAFRLVKSTLDPAGVLNPGVVVATPGQDPLAGLSPHRRQE
jgi:FAD/FMN-containing dehydrogenase